MAARWKKNPWGEALQGWACRAVVAAPPPYTGGNWRWRVETVRSSMDGRIADVTAHGDAATKREARRRALAAMKSCDRRR